MMTDNFPVNEGDTITMTVTASSTSSGTVNLDNVDTGQTASYSFPTLLSPMLP